MAKPLPSIFVGVGKIRIEGVGCLGAKEADRLAVLIWDSATASRVRAGETKKGTK